MPILVKNFSSYAWIVTVSRRGQVKKTPVSQWQVQRNNKMMTAMNLKKDDAMIRAFVVYAHEDLIMISRSGWISRYSSDLVPSTGTKSQGVKALNLAKDDSLAAACSYGDERQSLWVLSDKGNMKRVKMSDVSITARPVKGEIVVKRLKTNPYHIAYCQCVQPYDSLILMDPQVQILQAKDVPMMSREATFSTPLELKPEWGLIKGIEEVRIVDHPVGEDEIPFEDYEEDGDEKVHSDVEMMSLFEEE